MCAYDESKPYLEAVAALTEKHEAQELAVCLVQTVGALLPVHRVTLYALCNGQNDKEFNRDNIADAVVRDVLDAARHQRLLGDDAALLECVRRQQCVVEEVRDGQRRVLPLLGARDVVALFTLDGPPLSAFELDFIGYLLRIYRNQAGLLDKSEYDALTGLHNRQSFDERMKKIVAGLRNDARGVQPCLAIVDIDHFKQVNDRYGHLYGDEVLLLFARLMVRSFRQCDLLFRYGGEEFAVIIENDLDTALRVLERFRATVEAFAFPQIGRKTVSVGTVAIERGEPVTTVIDKADKALYHAKNSGRNRVCAYAHLLAHGAVAAHTATVDDVELF